MAKEEAIAANLGDAVDATQDLGVEWIGDVANDHAEERAAAPAQRPREEVRLVAEVLRRREDSIASRFPNRDTGLTAIQDAGHGRDRDTGSLGDVTERDRPARRLHLCWLPPTS